MPINRDSDNEITQPEEGDAAPSIQNEYSPLPFGAPLAVPPGTLSHGGLPPQSDAIPTAFPRIEGYHIIAKLGQGGMGAVYRATQDATRREVALKLMSGHAIGSEKARRRFEREVELASSLEHPNIARVYDSGLAKNVYFYAMRLIPGMPLDKHIEMNQLDERAILEVFLKVCRAVEFAHRKGVIHRDLKPLNVMVTPEGEPFVLDFGLAKTLLDDGEHLTVSQEGDLTGTPAYMSPEQASGHVKTIDTRTDVYALGVILFRLLTGDHPHDITGSAFDLTKRIIELEPKRPRTIKANLDRDLEAILLKCLEKEPAKRYGSAGGLADDIQRYLNNEPISAQPATATYFLKKRLARHKPLLALVVVLFVVFNAAVLFYFLSITAEQARTEKARQEAVTNEAKAVTQADRATRAEVIAQSERDTAKAEAEAARRSLYRANVALAHERYLAGDLGAVADLLGGCPSDLRNWEWRYLTNLATDRSFSLIGHSQHVRGIAFGPDSSLVASHDVVNDVIVWDLLRARALQRFSNDGVAVTGLSFSPKGDQLAIAKKDRGIELWEWRKMAMLATLVAEGETPSGVRWSPNGRWIASGTERGTVIVWDLESPSEPLKLEEGKDRVQAVAFHPTEPRLLSCYGDGDRQIKEWLLPSGTYQRSLGYAGNGKGYNSLQYSGDGKVIAANSNGEIHLFDEADGRLRKALRAPGESGFSLAINHDATRAVTAGWDHSVRVIDTATSATVLLHRGASHNVALTPDGRNLVVWGDISHLQVLPAERPSASRLTSGNNGVVAFSPNGRRLVTAAKDKDRNDLIVTPSEGGSESRLPSSWPVSLACFSADGKSVIGVGDNARVALWDTETGEITHETQLAGLRVLGIHPRQANLACAEEDGSLVITDLDGKHLRLLSNDTVTSPAQSAFFSANGRWLGSKHPDGSARIWDVDRGLLVQTLPKVSGHIVVPSSDGDRVATAGNRDSSISLWSVKSGRLIDTSKDIGTITCVIFSLDDSRLLSGGWSQNIRVYDGHDLRPIVSLQGSTDTIVQLAISGDGSMVASAGWGETRRWGIQSRIHRPSDGPIELLRLVDPARDAVIGEWTAISGHLRSDNQPNATIEFPARCFGSYELSVDFRRLDGVESFSVILPVEDTKVRLTIDGWKKHIGGLDRIDGVQPSENKTRWEHALRNGEENVLSIRVDTAGEHARITAILNGEQFLAWQGESSQLSADRVPIKFGIQTWESRYDISSVKLKLFDGEAWLNEPPALPVDARLVERVPEGGPIDLLRFVDPVKDAVKGQWNALPGAVALTKGESNARLAVPVMPRGSYRLRGEFTRTRSGSEKLVGFLLPVGSSHVLLALEPNGRNLAGLSSVNGHGVGDAERDTNPTIYQPFTLQDGRRYAIEIIVELIRDQARIAVYLDDNEIIRWSGPQNVLAAHASWGLPHNGQIGLASLASGVEFTFHRFDIEMLDGDLYLLRGDEPAKPDPDKPANE